MKYFQAQQHIAIFQENGYGDGFSYYALFDKLEDIVRSTSLVSQCLI